MKNQGWKSQIPEPKSQVNPKVEIQKKGPNQRTLKPRRPFLAPTRRHSAAATAQSIGWANDGLRGIFYAKSDMRMVDERAMLETLRALRTFHIMTKSILLRSLLAVAALAASPFLANTAHAVVGDILETNEGNVLRFRIPGATPSTVAAGLSNPKGIVFDGLGRFFVADAGKGSVIVYALPGGTGTTFVSGLNSPVGLAFDAAGALYIAESGSGNIIRIAQGGARSTFATGLGGPAGLAFDTSGNLFVADFSGGKIYKVAPDGSKSTFATGLNLPAGLAADSAGNLFVADSGSGTILKFAPDGSKSNFATGLGSPFGIALEAGGSLIVADNEEGATIRYSAAGARTLIFSSDFNIPQFVAIEPAAHQLLNISTRGLVMGGDNVLIAGFFVGGTGPVGTNVVVRALGPSLTPLGVGNALPDPVIELRDAFGTLIGSNNNWKDSQQEAIMNTGLAPTDERESALVTTLNGGSFTAIVGSATGETGTAVVEVYNLQ
jgi:sugar lactone lactonase YvrE